MAIVEAGAGVIENMRDALRAHRTYSHPLFDRLAEPAVDARAFRVFAANFMARTVFTLSEILAGCQDAALDLNFTRIAYGVLTAADEGGFGRPLRVHPRLMESSLNNHLVMAYGDSPIRLREIFLALQGLDYCDRLTILESISQQLSPSDRRSLANTLLIPEMSRRLTCIEEQVLPERKGLVDAEVVRLQQLREELARFLELEQVLPATVDYCLAQLKLLRNPDPGYLAGVTYAHEFLGDRLFVGVCQALAARRAAYRDDSFLTTTYEYVREHGDYLLLNDSNDAERIEDIHFQREEEKLNSLRSCELDAAFRGALDFCERDCRVWDGILNSL